MDTSWYMTNSVLTNVKKHVSCIHSLRIEIINLRNQSEIIATIREFVSGRVEADRRKQMMALLQVTEWLNKVNSIRNEAHHLLQEAEDLLKQSSCLSSCCYSPGMRWSAYKMARKLSLKTEEMHQLGKDGDFEVVSVLVSQLRLMEAEPIELLPSQKLQLTQVWSCLEGESMGIIGIFGTGGIGKTTVLKNIHTELIKHPLNFDVLIFARVSQVPNIDKIQDEIRRSLGILDHLWKKKSPEERTRDISVVLTKTKFVLLLDDIWPGFDFAQVGVPLPKESQNKSKVVFTTRSEEVCNHMNTDQRFRIEALPEEEGRTLFSKTVGEDTLGSNRRIKDLAMNIADKCGVLPLAIVTIGGVLAKQKNVEVWEDTLGQLQESNLPEFSGMIKILFRNLKLSYGLLEDETTKSCFRYCSLLPKVDPDQLIDYWIGEGFLGESKPGIIDDARDRGYTIIEGLLKACLLMAEDSSVRMHDIVREVVLGIAKENESLLVRVGAYLTEAPEAVEWEGAERISLTRNGIEKLPTRPPVCRFLKTLILFKSGLKTIPNGLFACMPCLRVLDLSWCEMEEHILVQIGNSLRRLHYLSLSHTNITKLPIEFNNLVDLLVLDLSYTAELNTIPLGLLQSLIKLLVLNTYCSGSEEWIAEDGEMVVGSQVFLEELQSLKFLNHLGISIKDVKALNALGKDSTRNIQNSTHSLLVMKCKDLKDLKLSCIKYMVRLRQLEIRNCADLINIKIMVPEIKNMRKEPFYSLQHVKIVECWSLQNVTWLSHVPNLETLEIDTCMNIRAVVDTESTTNTRPGTSNRANSCLFPRLKRMHLINLPALSCISRSEISFRALEIRVSYCPKLKKLPGEPTTFKLIEGQRKWWNELEWDDDEVKNALLLLFKEIQY